MKANNVLTVRILIVFFFFFYVKNNAFSKDIDCNKHPIYCQIKKNRPKISNKYAMKLSNIIYRSTRVHRIPPRIFTAILAQESGYRLEAMGCHRGLDRETYAEVRICSDFGIGQIYFKTARSYKFDIEKLTTDLEYSVDAAAQVLSEFKMRYERKEVDWWTRYNARSRFKRDMYKKFVERFF